MRKYSEIVPDYETYQELQKRDFCSFESANPRWEEGQRRFIRTVFANTDRDLRILDIACGDGVGLREFRALGFSAVAGVEFNSVKARKAREIGYPVYELDMHDLNNLEDGSFDIVYSSHTLEHSYYPERAIGELARVLVSQGSLFVVLPYPDTDDSNIRAHGAKDELGTSIDDQGKNVINFFTARGFELKSHRFDSFREPEIWLCLRKRQVQ